MANKVLEIKTQTNERITLLGDKNPDHTENNYQDKLTQIRQQLENATKNVHDDIADLHAQKATIESLNLTIKELANKLSQSKVSFEQALMASAFDTQAEFWRH